MFNLESEISKWRAGLAAAGLTPEAAAELENHLRDDILRSLKESTADEVAFELAKSRIGNSGEIKREFDRATPTAWFFRIPHWGKLVLGTAIGAAVALGISVLFPRPWQSEARIYVRAAFESSPTEEIVGVIGTPDARGAIVRDAHARLMTSMDLALKVADGIGPEPIVGSSDRVGAAVVILGGLKVQISPDSSVMTVSFAHQNKDIVQVVLRELIARYERSVSELIASYDRRIDSDHLGVGPGPATVKIRVIESATPAFRREFASAFGVGWGILLGIIWVGFDMFRSRSKPPRNPPRRQSA